MKKFLTLVLALVLAFALAAPAMAFTTDDVPPSEATPFELDIYLVEHEDDALFGLTGWPPVDRGYAKNEIVAAVVELFAPKNADMSKYGYLELSAKSASFNVTDNAWNGTYYLLTSVKDAQLNTIAGDPINKVRFAKDGDNLVRDRDVIRPATLTKDTTYKWLVFAKVTGDNASLTAKLVDGFGNEGGWTKDGAGNEHWLDVTLEEERFDIDLEAIPGSTDKYFIVTMTSGTDNHRFTVRVDKNWKSLGMRIDPDGFGGGFYALGVNVAGELGIVSGSQILTSGEAFDEVMDVYEDIVIDIFGMDYFLIGNYVRKSYFANLVSGKTITATVDIKPWTAYVKVPDNIVVDPPKTGAAASILGFVMVALSGAAALTLKKR